MPHHTPPSPGGGGEVVVTSGYLGVLFIALGGEDEGAGLSAHRWTLVWAAVCTRAMVQCSSHVCISTCIHVINLRSACMHITDQFDSVPDSLEILEGWPGRRAMRMLGSQPWRQRSEKYAVPATPRWRRHLERDLPRGFSWIAGIDGSEDLGATAWRRASFAHRQTRLRGDPRAPRLAGRR